jgi:iron(III) transport system ATP-binding protein
VLNGSDSALRGTVTDRTYLGNLCEYDIRLASGRSLRAQTHPEVLFDQGSAVGVAFETSRVSVFRAAQNDQQQSGGQP